MDISSKAKTNEAQQQLVSITQQKQQLERLSILLDEAFTLPVIGVRVGWDAIIGLVPVIGDGAGAIISSYFIYKALRFKMPLTTVAKMLLNIGIELLIGIVPIVGDVLDVAWKANRRNYRLMEGLLEEQEKDLMVYCQQQNLSNPTDVKPKGLTPESPDSRGNLMMLLVFVLIICSMVANKESLESLVSIVEREIESGAAIGNPEPAQLDIIKPGNQP